MDNIDNEALQKLSESQEERSLWLTDTLMVQLRNSSKIGVPLMVLSIFGGILIATLSLFTVFFRWSRIEGDFYLLEGGNLYNVIHLLGILLVIYTFARSMVDGYKSWRLLRTCQADDNALLEGTERLGMMLRWFTICGAIYLSTTALKLIWRSLM